MQVFTVLYQCSSSLLRAKARGGKGKQEKSDSHLAFSFCKTVQKQPRARNVRGADILNLLAINLRSVVKLLRPTYLLIIAF